MKKVVVIILNWNGREMLLNCLSSLAITDYPNFSTIVVDNGSTDRSADLVSQRFPNVDLIRLPQNLGYQAGNNAGLRCAIEKYDPDHVAFLNNDTIVTQKGWLTHMVWIAESNPSVGLVNCRYVFPDGTPQTTGLMLLPGIYLDRLLRLPFKLRNTKEQSDYVHDTVTAGGPCFLVKRSVVDAIGMLDEGYAPVYFEDIDYSLRAKRAGFRLVHDGSVSMVHLGMASAKKLPDTYVSYIYRKNLLRYLRNYYPLMVPTIFIFLLLGSLLRTAEFTGRRRKDSSALEYLRKDLGTTRRALRVALKDNREKHLLFLNKP